MEIKNKYQRFFSHIFEWADKHRFLFLTFISITTMAIAFAVAYWYKETYGVTLQNRVTFLFTSIMIIILMVFFYVNLQRRIINERFEWTVGVINHLSERIENIKNNNCVEENHEQSSISYKWPWGNHNTKDLEHLAAAAERFWKLYDPSDFTTAPTNKVVAEWLVTTRGVARDRANYMASILRADGLPDGPRR